MNKELLSYAMDFVSFLTDRLDDNDMGKIKDIVLFGSAARGEADKKSDIDVFVEFEKPIGLDFMDLAIFLEELFGKKVDILTPEGIKSIRVRKIASNIEKSIIYA